MTMDKIKITIYPADPRDMHALGVRRFAEYEFEADTLGAATITGTIYDPKVPQRITEEGNRQLRAYLTGDLESAEELRKRFEIDQIITEALVMQARGRPAPLPRPTYLAVAIRAIYDDLESWSSLK